MMDVDHFKRFNSDFGHDAGDAVLAAVGRLCRSHFRAEDIVCRYGGEEFLCILPGSQLADAVRRAEVLRTAAKSMMVKARGQALSAISLSFGVAAFPDHGASAEAVLHAADAALRRAKQTGRDRVVVLESEPALLDKAS
jgi:diguanylate cyclase (GGDEF)-like protein